MRPVTSIDDPRYVKALSHPLRVRILAMLQHTLDAMAHGCLGIAPAPRGKRGR